MSPRKSGDKPNSLQPKDKAGHSNASSPQPPEYTSVTPSKKSIDSAKSTKDKGKGRTFPTEKLPPTLKIPSPNMPSSSWETSNNNNKTTTTSNNRDSRQQESLTQNSGSQRNKVNKVTHYGRLRTTITRALRFAEIVHDKFPPPLSRAESNPNQDTSSPTTPITPSATRNRASLDTNRLSSLKRQSVLSPKSGGGSSGYLSGAQISAKRHSLSTSIENADDHVSLAATALADEEEPLTGFADTQEMARVIPLPGFFLDPESDEWVGGYSYRARSRDPLALLSVPASLTKRVHFETSYDHPKNGISTARYNVFTFLPAQLIAQFSKVANIYFLFISILQQVPGWSTTGKWSTLLPLCIFVTFSIAHEGYDDFRRHRLDRAENRQKARVLKVKVHNKERVSFHIKDARRRSSHSLHELRKSTSSGIHKAWGGVSGKIKGVHQGIIDHIAEKKRKQREAEDSEDEEDEGEIDDERELGDVEDVMSMTGSVAAGATSINMSVSSFGVNNLHEGVDGEHIQQDIEAPQLQINVPPPYHRGHFRSHSSFANMQNSRLSLVSNGASPHLNMPQMKNSPTFPSRSNTPDLFGYGTPMTRSFTDRMLAGDEAGDNGSRSALSPVLKASPNVGTEVSSIKEHVRAHSGVAFADEDEIFDIYDNPLPDNMNCRWKRKRWENIQVGDLLVLLKDEWIPADCVVLASSGYDGICYVETASLDGETTLKQRQALKVTNEAIQTPEMLATYNGITYVEKPNPDLYSFEGYVETEGEKHPLTPTQLLLRGSVLRNTQYVFVQVVYSGEETRLRLNATRNIRTKSPQLQRITNRVVVLVFLLLVVVCTVFSWIFLATQSDLLSENWYLTNPEGSTPDEMYNNVKVTPPATIFGNIVMLNAMIPISLYVTLEAIKIFQMYFIQQDRGMYYEPTQRCAEVRTTTINEDLGMVRYVFSDKTGTLTENIMKFRGMMAGGMPFVHKDVDREMSASTEGESNGENETKVGNNYEAITSNFEVREEDISSSSRMHYGTAGSGLRKRNHPFVREDTAEFNNIELVDLSPSRNENTETSIANIPSRVSNMTTTMANSDDLNDGPVFREPLLGALTTTRALLRGEFSTYQSVTPNLSQPQANSSSPMPASGHKSIDLSIHTRRFLRSLALCHTVQPDFSDKTGEVVGYQAASPDEKALVVAAAEMGYIVSNRAGSKVQLRVVRPERLQKFFEDGCPQPIEKEKSNDGKAKCGKSGVSKEESSAAEPTEEDAKVEERIASIIPSDDTDMYEDYEVLDVIEFTSARKRMSVVYKCPNGKIFLFTKGADSAIWPRLKPSEQVKPEPHYDPFIPLDYQQPARSFMPIAGGGGNGLGLMSRRKHLARPPAAILHSRSSSTNTIDFALRSVQHPGAHDSPGSSRPQTPSALGPQAAIPPHVTGRGRHSRSRSHTYSPSPSSQLGRSSPTPAGNSMWSPYLMSSSNNDGGNSDNVQSLPHSPTPPSMVATSSRQSASQQWELDGLNSATRSETLPVDPQAPPSDAPVSSSSSETNSCSGEEWNRKKAQEALQLFSTEGLRTLMYAHKEIPLPEYEEWHDRYVAATTALAHRQQQVEQVAEELERDLCFTGVSAIEDRLQEGVPESIFKLRQAGIKIWMLTGDKVETAVNIAKSCRLVDDNTESEENVIMLTGAKDADKLRTDLERAFASIREPLPDLTEPTRAISILKKVLPEFVLRMTGLINDDSKASNRKKRKSLFNRNKTDITIANTYTKHGEKETSVSSDTDKEVETTTSTSNTFTPYIDRQKMSIVVDGDTLSTLEENIDLLKLFLELGTHSNAVICSRVSPAQKALVVHHMRVRCQNAYGKDKYAVTVAIGDGGNDIAMIQESHVGVGIAGQEGLQAARSADFSISQFRFLQRLILVHGRWSYIRIATFTMATFYKCIAFYLTQLVFGVFAAFTGTSIYESFTLSMYNTLFVILPVLIIGIFDQDLQADTLLKHPELYPLMGPSNHLYSVGLFFRHVMVIGIVHAILVGSMILIPHYNISMMATTPDLYMIGFIMFSTMVLVVVFKVSYIDSSRWTWVTHAGVCLSLVAWFGWNGLLGIFYQTSTSSGYFASDVFQYIKDRGAYWALIIVTAATALCLTLLFKTCSNLTSHTEKIFQSWVLHERTRPRPTNDSIESINIRGALRNNCLDRVKDIWQSSKIRDRVLSTKPTVQNEQIGSSSSNNRAKDDRKGKRSILCFNRRRSSADDADPNIDFGSANSKAKTIAENSLPVANPPHPHSS